MLNSFFAHPGEAKCETPFPPILSPNSMPPTYNKVFLLDLNGPEKVLKKTPSKKNLSSKVLCFNRKD